MRPTIRSLLAASALAVALAASAGASATPNVVASIKPVHSLVAGVMEGVATPHLFVAGGDSPHTFAMRPSDAEALARADAVFWVGPAFEGFLERPIANLAADVLSVALIEAPGLVLHEYEEDHHHDHGHGHEHEEHAHADDGHGHEDGHSHDDGHSHNDGHTHDDGHAHEDGYEHGHAHEGTDGHVWLDPANARAMVAAIIESMVGIDPANAEIYEANGAAMSERLEALEADVASRLAPYSEVGFFTFHDAFRYFAERFDMNSRGAITVSPERQPGAQRLAEIRAEIGTAERVCVFAEPQFPPSLVDVVVEGTQAGTGVIDPLGAEIADGPGLYFELMEFNVDAFERCFAAL